MSRRNRASTTRFRVGKVTVYQHHSAWWLYYTENGERIRRKVSESRKDAEQLAAQINSQLASNTPTLLSFQAISLVDLRQHFLDYHEHVLKSSVATLRRYKSATQHLDDFVRQQRRQSLAHEVRPEAFATYLRKIEVAPNGHSKTKKRRLRDKGVQFILETCRSMFNYAVKRRHLPPYVGNPFSELPLDRLKIEDAKPIFVFDSTTELAFFKAASDWAFAVNFTLAKTGLRIGELIHLLIEDVDLHAGWLHVRNKTELGWRIKTGQERCVPLLPAVIAILRYVIGHRATGPVFLRQKLDGKSPKLIGNKAFLERVVQERVAAERGDGQVLCRRAVDKIARKVWWDAGALKPDAIRNTFMRIMKKLDKPESTCPKSWRHTFATLLQDANVDPLIRQQTLGHKPTNKNGLGMTGNYTHTRPETLRQQIEAALRHWPESLAYAMERVGR